MIMKTRVSTSAPPPFSHYYFAGREIEESKLTHPASKSRIEHLIAAPERLVRHKRDAARYFTKEHGITGMKGIAARSMDVPRSLFN